MGNKGDKMKQESVLAAELLVTKLESIGGITSKKMFGGHGVFHDGKMFGIVDSAGSIFLKTDDTTKLEFEKRGSIKHGKMPYYLIPEDIINNADLLIEWSKKAITIA